MKIKLSSANRQILLLKFCGQEMLNQSNWFERGDELIDKRTEHSRTILRRKISLLR